MINELDLDSPAVLVPVCDVDRLTPNRGVAAMIDGEAVAVFWLGGDDVYAVSNVDPCSGRSVLSRGIVGDAAGVPTVASPLYKQRFDLRTGECLDRPGTFIDVRPAAIVDGTIHVGPAGP